MNTKAAISGLVVAVLLGLNTTTAHAQNGMAMTWKNKTDPVFIGNAGNIGGQRIVVVGCSSCEPYKGDTSIQEKLRILCIVPGNQPEPAVYATHISANNYFKKFYYNWSGGQIGLTKKVKGEDITSQAMGDKLCVKGLSDNNARMIEHHDNKVGGWNLGGFIHPNSQAQGQLKNPNNTQKYWARIKNQPANPWNNP